MPENNVGFLNKVLNPESKRILNNSGILEKMQANRKGAQRPLVVICETINTCNSDCVFCPYIKQNREKGLMSIDLFRKILSDYDSMGGGIFSLTPIVGDVLLDKYLHQRTEILREYSHSIFPTFTTNLYALDRHSDETIELILASFKKIEISIIGISPEETLMLTQRNHFSRLVKNFERLLTLWKESPQTCDIGIAFRLAHKASKSELEGFQLSSWGHVFPYTSMHRYANWGGAMMGQLPADAQYHDPRVNFDSCVLLLVAVQIYWDGKVSACACCDYDASHELYLGDLNENSLLEIYNGQKNERIWLQHETGKLPNICKECTFHRPLKQLHPNHPIAIRITDFIGG